MDPRFTYPLVDSYYQDPRTGEIIDQDTGQIFSSPTELRDHATTLAAGGSPKETGSPIPSGQAMSMAPTALTAYYLSQMGGPAAAAGAPAAVAGGAATAGTTAAAAPGAVPAMPHIVSATTGTMPTALESLGSSGIAQGGFGLGLGPISVPGVAAGAVTGYNQIKGGQNILQDKKPSWLQHAAMFPITGGLDVLARPFLGGGKDKDHRARDSYRAGVKDAAPGFFDEGKNTVTLSSGASLDWGKDGREKLQNADGGSRHYFDVDFSRGDSGDLAAALDPAGAIIANRTGKGRSDMTGYLVNTAQAGGDPWANAHEEYDKLGLDYNTARDLINTMKIDQGEKDTMFNSLDHVYGVNAYSGKPWKGSGAPPKPVAAAAPAQPVVPKIQQVTRGANMIPRLKSAPKPGGFYAAR